MDDQGTGALRTSRVLVMAAAGLNAGVGVFLWRLLAGEQEEMWPFPGLYLVEVALLPAAVALVALSRPSVFRPAAATASGALWAFCVLGAASVGVLYVPGALLVTSSAMVGRGRAAVPRLSPPVLFVAGAAVQALGMFAAVAAERAGG